MKFNVDEQNMIMVKFFDGDARKAERVGLRAQANSNPNLGSGEKLGIEMVREKSPRLAKLIG